MDKALSDDLQDRPICRRCNLPLGEVGAFDPDNPNPGTISYMHPDCATQTHNEMVERRRLREIRLSDAAPAMLAALKACMAYIPGSEVHSWPPGHGLKGKAIKLATAAIKQAEGA